MMLRVAGGAVGMPSFMTTAGSALVAGAAMAVVMAALQVLLPVALVVGGIVYVGAFVLAERRVAPADLQVLAGMLPQPPSGTPTVMTGPDRRATSYRPAVALCPRCGTARR